MDSVTKSKITFDDIKISINRYKQSSLIFRILATLQIVQDNNNIRYPIWNLFSLLKWSYLYAIESILKRIVTEQDLQELMLLVEKYETSHQSLNFKYSDTRVRSLKIILFQQSPLQNTFYKASINRQIILFSIFNTKFCLKEKFKEVTGIALKDFLNLCFFTYLYLNADKLGGKNKYDGILYSDYFDVLNELSIDKKTVDRFLSLLTITTKEDISNLHKLAHEQLQLFETTFLTTKPLVSFRNILRVPHRSIFDLTMHSYVYNIMKTSYPDTFSEDFGKRLERYLELGLKECGIEYENESILKRKYNLSKVVDYRIAEHILVECKAIELHPRSGILRRPEILQNELKSSIIKAYSQILSTANSIDPNQNWYGLVVTYKETYIGFGNDAWDEFLEKPITDFCIKNNIPISILKPENLFFITAEYWDYLMQILKNGKVTFTEILERGKILNKTDNISEKVLLLDQVLTKYYPIKKIKLKYLEKSDFILDLIPKKTTVYEE